MTVDDAGTIGDLVAAVSGPRPRAGRKSDVADTRRLQRRRLVAAVLLTVAERGYVRTTIADIAGRAQVSRATFYEHFTDKQDCYLAAYDSVQRMLWRTSGRSPDRDPASPRTPAERFADGIGEFAHAVFNEPAVTRAIYEETPTLGAAGIEVRRLADERWARSMTRIVNALRESDPRLRERSRPMTPAAAYVANSAINAVTVRAVNEHLREGGPADRDGLRDAIVLILTSAISLDAVALAGVFGVGDR